MRAIATVIIFAIVNAASVSARSAHDQLPPPTEVRPVLTLEGGAAILTVIVRPDRALVFEDLVERLKSALQRSSASREQAAGWQIFKSVVVQGNAAYVMRIDPVVKGAEYDLPRLLADAYPDEAVALNRAYRTAVVGRSIMSVDSVNIDGLGQVADLAAPEISAAPPLRPAMSFEEGDAAMVTILVRRERTGDFESVLRLMGKALQSSHVPGRKTQAAGWRVFRSRDIFEGNIAYVMSLDPLQKRAEYDPIRLIQEVYPAMVDGAFEKYRAAYFGHATVRLVNRMPMHRQPF